VDLPRAITPYLPYRSPTLQDRPWFVNHWKYMTAAKTQRVASRQRGARFPEHLVQSATGTWLRLQPPGFFRCCAKKTSRQLVCVGENKSPKRARKEKAPGRHVVPGGQRTSHLFRERLDGCMPQLPCHVCSPDSIFSNHAVDKTPVGLHAERNRSAVRRNAKVASPVQTLPRGCFTPKPTSQSEKRGRPNFLAVSFATTHSC
jgi:hypothetical protein